MNEVFLIGKVMQEVEFDFLFRDNRHISIAKIKVILSDSSIIEVFGYNEIADKLYRNINLNDIIFVYGRLEGDKVKILCFILM